MAETKAHTAAEIVTLLETIQVSLGEGIHTGFRKATDHEAANRAWKAIKDLPHEDWAAVCHFALDGMGVLAALKKARAAAKAE